MIQQTTKDYLSMYKTNKQNLPPGDTYRREPYIFPLKRDIYFRLANKSTIWKNKLLRYPNFHTHQELRRFHPTRVLGYSMFIIDKRTHIPHFIKVWMMVILGFTIGFRYSTLSTDTETRRLLGSRNHLLLKLFDDTREKVIRKYLGIQWNFNLEKKYRL